MARTPTRTDIAVKVDIRPESASDPQRQAWKRFWQKLIAEVKASER